MQKKSEFTSWLRFHALTCFGFILLPLSLIRVNEVYLDDRTMVSMLTGCAFISGVMLSTWLYRFFDKSGYLSLILFIFFLNSAFFALPDMPPDHPLIRVQFKIFLNALMAGLACGSFPRRSFNWRKSNLEFFLNTQIKVFFLVLILAAIVLSKVLSAKAGILAGALVFLFAERNYSLKKLKSE